MSAIPFSMLGSSGATQYQVSEFQPAREQLLTEYFMFGYEFDPSNWVALAERTGPFNPINDLLNPLSVDSNELLQRQSIEYIEEQMLKQRWMDLKDKELFLKFVPEKLSTTVADLYDRGVFKASTSPTEMDKIIDSLITQGTLGTYDAGRLRALIAQRATFSQLTTQNQAQNAQGDLEAIISAVQQQLLKVGIPAGANSRSIIREALHRELDAGTPLRANILVPRLFTQTRIDVSRDVSRIAPIGGRSADIEEYVGEQEITDSQALGGAGTGLGTRLSSAPVLTSASADLGFGGARPSFRATLTIDPFTERAVRGQGGARPPPEREVRVRDIDEEELIRRATGLSSSPKKKD